MSASRARKPDMPKPPWKPTRAEGMLIEALAGHGVKAVNIAAQFSVSVATLKRNATAHLKRGRDGANANVIRAAFLMAVDGEHPEMTRFWLETQLKWERPSRLQMAMAVQAESEGGAIRIMALAGDVARLMEQSGEGFNPLELEALPEGDTHANGTEPHINGAAPA